MKKLNQIKFVSKFKVYMELNVSLNAESRAHIAALGSIKEHFLNFLYELYNDAILACSVFKILKE